MPFRPFDHDLHALVEPYHAQYFHAKSKSFFRMFNKLQDPADHGNITLAKPRPMRNVDVNRCAIVVKDHTLVATIFRALRAKYKIARVKNVYQPPYGSQQAYRTLLVNFHYDSGVTWRQLFGTGHLAPGGKSNTRFVASDSTAEKWRAYVLSQAQNQAWGQTLVGLWNRATETPDARVKIIAEVQIIYEPYLRGREKSHLLFKISRCNSPMDMQRDFKLQARLGSLLSKAQHTLSKADADPVLEDAVRELGPVARHISSSGGAKRTRKGSVFTLSSAEAKAEPVEAQQEGGSGGLPGRLLTPPRERLVY